MSMKSFVVCWLLLMFFTAVGVAGAAEKNLVSLHKDVSKMSNKECLTCHADILKAASLNKKIKTFHRLHLESKLGTPKQCNECHQSVDVMNGSAAGLRKQVDPQICAGCHRGEVKGAKVLFAQ